jgi:hypothetical protein
MRDVHLREDPLAKEHQLLIGMDRRLDSAALAVRRGGVIGRMNRRSSLWMLSRELVVRRGRSTSQSALYRAALLLDLGSLKNHLQAAKLGGDGREEKEQIGPE